MNRKTLVPYISHVLDDALSADHTVSDLLDAAGEVKPGVRLVAYQCGFEPLVVAVMSYLPGVAIEADEAEEIASDYLREIKWLTREDMEIRVY